MVEITASLVKQLRDKTHLPMMECKKALQEAQGDLEKAEEILRKSGALAAASKVGRETAEGRVATGVLADHAAAGIVEIRCETAPVANTEHFVEMCRQIAQHVAAAEDLPDDVDGILGQSLASDPTVSVQDLMNDAINKIRENMQFVRFARLAGGVVAGYEHHNGQVAAIVQLDADGGLTMDDQLAEFARDLCMHIAAMNPTALDRDQMPKDLVEKEKEIIQAQVEPLAQNKPPQVVEKIVQGKLNKWYNDQVLLEQPFVKEDKKTVKQFISEFSKSFGRTVKVKQYVRYEVGGVQ